MSISNIIGKVETHSFTDIPTIKNTLDYLKNLKYSEVNEWCIDSLNHGFNGLLNGSKRAICYIPKNLII